MKGALNCFLHIFCLQRRLASSHQKYTNLLETQPQLSATLVKWGGNTWLYYCGEIMEIMSFIEGRAYGDRGWGGDVFGSAPPPPSLLSVKSMKLSSVQFCCWFSSSTRTQLLAPDSSLSTVLLLLSWMQEDEAGMRRSCFMTFSVSLIRWGYSSLLQSPCIQEELSAHACKKVLLNV